MADSLNVTITLSPCDPWAFSANHPERANNDYDLDLARKHEPVDYDDLMFKSRIRLMIDERK